MNDFVIEYFEKIKLEINEKKKDCSNSFFNIFKIINITTNVQEINRS